MKFIKKNWVIILICLIALGGFLYYNYNTDIRNMLKKDISDNDNKIENIQKQIEELKKNEEELKTNIISVNTKVDIKFNEINDRIKQFNSDKQFIINNKNDTNANLKYINDKYGK